MTSVPQHRDLVIGVDTHRDTHVAVALDPQGVRLGKVEVRSTQAGLRALRAWAARLGTVATWGIEGTGSYGAGLARQLLGRGHHVVEVNRPDRRVRRLLGGKSDPIDAEAAARSVLAGFATTVPKAGDGTVELIRITRAARCSAVKARTMAMNQLKAIIVTAPPALRDQLGGLTPAKLVARCVGFRPPAAGVNLEAGVKRTLRALAQRWRVLDAEAKAHGAELQRLVASVAPQLLAEHGVGPDSAAAVLIAAGDNPERLRSEAAFAALCGASPIPASSGKTERHRLNRGGDRQANAALYRITVVRLATHSETQTYMATHLSANGSNKAHVIRCLKRYLARRLFPLVLEASSPRRNDRPHEVAA